MFKCLSLKEKISQPSAVTICTGNDQDMMRACGVDSSTVIGVALPNGPELGVCVISCMACAICAPVNVDLTPEEMMNDLKV